MIRAMVILCAAVVCAGVATAGMIDEASFFSGLTTTQINFEVDGFGYPVTLAEDSWATLFYDEYSSQGVTFDQDIWWVNDSGADFESAQSIGGWPEIAIPGPSYDTITLSFSPAVHSVGMWVINNNTVGVDTTFTAKTSGGATIETVALADVVDGTIGVADYGFMGIWSETEIASLTVTKDAALLDNLMFSTDVPEPATLAVLTLGAAVLLRRRR